MKKSIKLFTTVMVCMAMALCVSCKKDDDDNNPGGGGGGTQTVATVTTGDVTDITQATAVCGGEVKSENGWAVTERGVCWGTEPNPTPSDNCTVDGEGVGAFTSEITGLAPDTKYYVRAYAKNAAGTGFGEQRSFTTQGTGGGGGGTGDHAYVDLGLPSGLLWATCNVGADSPEDYGDYFAWGETETKSYYYWSTYKWCNGNHDNLTKYCTDSDYGTVDNKTVLDPEDDAAHVNWGGDWRMPTTEEWSELYDRCNWTWTTQGGEDGYSVAGPNGKRIFLPASGDRYGTSLDGRYWSSSLDSSYPDYASGMCFGSGYVYPQSSIYRFIGFTVRPVR